MKITLTEAASDRILKVMEMQGRSGSKLRVRVAGRTPVGYRHELGFVPADGALETDTAIEAGELTILVDDESASRIDGTEIDYVENLQGAGFVFRNPNPVTYSDQETGVKLAELFESTINPGLASHGGFAELLDVKDNIVFLRLGGGCQGCGMANVTLKQGIERMIMEAVPEIERVIDSTDHADGQNPYYAP